MKLLTTGEVAHRLGRSSEQVRRYEKAGLIAAHRTERGYRLFLAEDVVALKKRLRRSKQEGSSKRCSPRLSRRGPRPDCPQKTE